MINHQANLFEPLPRKFSEAIRKVLGFKWAFVIGIAFSFTFVGLGSATAQICTSYLASLPKDSRLYLYFPTVDDPSFPTDTLGNITGINSQPLGAFTAANLDADLTATSAQLRDRITEQVRDSYCEFNVDVILSTTEPNPGGTAWQVIGIGADSDAAGGRFGRAQDIDTGDADLEDYARVWAVGFHDAYGTAGGAFGEALAPPNATLERWSTAIAGTVAHESGHNYGLSHGSSAARAGTSEDQQNNHLLATGNTGLTDVQRVTRRHFSDTSFETLAYNLGLNTKTLSNWDFVNPNDSDASGLRMRLLSTATTLSLSNVYNGTLSPWTNPSLTKQAGTQNFRGTVYNIYDLTFVTGKNWSNGTSGVVPAGIKFHVGAGVDADAVVYDVTLTDSGGDMDLHPRMFGFSFGLADDTDDTPMGAGQIRFLAGEDDENDLWIENIVVRFLPRPISLNEMVEGGGLIAADGLAVEPFTRRGLARKDDRRIQSFVKQAEVGTEFIVSIAHLTDRRHLDLTIQPSAICDKNNRTIATEFSGPFDRPDAIEEQYCQAGDYLSLFPATSIYVTATVVDPNAKYFDPGIGAFVTGRLESKLYTQIAGVIPDLNNNGEDDYIDIREGRDPDANGNGIPDSADKDHAAGAIFGDWSIYGGIGLALPKMSGLDNDLSGKVGIDRHLAGNKSVGLRLGYHRFDVGPGLADDKVFEFSIRGDQNFHVSPKVRLFAGIGAGAYFFDPGDTEFGVHTGVGVGYNIGPRVDLELSADYHEIISSPADFGTMYCGLRIQF